jgi:hypothetical protein
MRGSDGYDYSSDKLLCLLGLSIRETTDVAKYNGYVVYNTVNGETPEVSSQPIL